MRSDAGTDIINNNILDPGQFLYEFRRQSGVLRAVSMDDAYRNRAVGRITRVFATRSARVRMDFFRRG